MDQAESRRLARLPKRRRRPAASSRADAFAKHVVDYYGGLCHICGCGGARQADHLIPVTERPDLAFKLSNARPAHGAPGNACPVCSPRAGKPVYCNQLRGNGSVERAQRIIAERIAGKSPPEARTPGARGGSRPEPEPHPDAGRPW